MSGSKINIPNQPSGTDPNQPLPQFRKDLQLVPGPSDPDGSPTYNIFDPVRAKYYKISWYEAVIIKNLEPGMTLNELVKIVSDKTSMQVSVRDLEMFFYDAKAYNLLNLASSSDELIKHHESRSVNPILWFLFHYLYFRIPLFYPDNFLEKTLPYVKPLVSKYAVYLYLFIATTGFLMLMTRFDQFIGTFTYFFNWKGIAAYAVAILFTKIFHELGHAYTAKNYGLHVPVMGIALIILWPVMYTDASDAWKLPNRKHRFAISIAGIAVELVIAGIATWGWFFTEPGIMQSVFFLLASVSWVSSLFINLNPCMRFDGYYLLSDIWGIDNLQTRAFAVAKWKLREILLGIDASPPEVVSHKRMVGMVTYSIATWIYRLFLYLGIALIIYYNFTKVLGVLMFASALIVFIGMPLYGEIKDLIKLKKLFKVNVRLLFTTLILSLVFIWFVVPIPHTITFPAVTTADENQVVFIPEFGEVEKIFVEKGQAVVRGQPLLLIRSEDLEKQIEGVILDIKIVQKQILVASLDPEMRVTIASRKAELDALYSKLKSLKQRQNELLVKASISGTIYEWNNDIIPGQFVAQDFVIGKIAQLNKIQVEAFVPESDIEDISKEKDVIFIPNRTMEKIEGNIKRIRTGRDIELDYAQLASIHGGELATVKGKEDKIKLVESYYVIDITLEDDEKSLKIGQLGYVEVSGVWRSKLMELVRFLGKIFYRESGV